MTTPVNAAANAPEGEAPAGPSKGELKRMAKEAEKEKKRIEREAREAKERAAREAADVVRELAAVLCLEVIDDVFCTGLCYSKLWQAANASIAGKDQSVTSCICVYPR